MNKTKRVAWHKHLKTMKKRAEKAKATRGANRAATPQPPQRPAARRA